MKFPKFIKSQPSKEFVGGDQLLLTESTYSVMTNNNKFFTPQKRVAYIINDYKYINDKTYNIQTPKPQTPLVNSTPFASKADTSIADLFQFKTPLTASTKHVNFIDSVGSPRCSKTSAKRLQRNRLQHVKAKPSNYVLRSSVLRNKADCLDAFVTPIKAINEESTTESMMMNTSNNSTKLTDKKTTVKTNQPEQLEQKQNNSTQTETKRFSLSRLTKLVSQSALKVLTPSSNNKSKDRRSYGSNCSSLSSISFQTDDANDTVEDEVLEPPKVININLVKLIDRVASPVKRKVPCMGVSSVMIKNLKAKNQLTSNFKPDLQLVSKPIIFNSTDLKSTKYSTNNIYDKLDRNALMVSSKPAPRKATPTYLRHQTTCRITVFNGNHKQVINTGRKHYSSSQLNDSISFDKVIF